MNTFLTGDSLEILKQFESKSINCCVTSPPYWGLRDYGIKGQSGLEKTQASYIRNLVSIFVEVHRVLRDDGTLWLNLGDCYVSGNLQGIPWRVAFALQGMGWILRSDIIWNKTNAMPESVSNRPTKSHEYIFLFSKKKKYFYDLDSIREPYTEVKTGSSATFKRDHSKRGASLCPSSPMPTHRPEREDNIYGHGGRNKRTIWNVATRPYSGAHFAVFPPELIRPCILAGCPVGGKVLDPFGGSGTVAMVANDLKRDSIYIDINPEYTGIAKERTMDGNGIS